MEHSGFCVLYVGDPHVDNPVHQVEADEANGEYDSRIFINVTRIDPAKLVRVLQEDRLHGRA